VRRSEATRWIPGSVSELLMPRYTERVGRVGRIATVVLIVLLAGGPVLASVCQAMCVPPAATTQPTASEGAHSRGHHHQAAAQTPAHVQQTAVRHDHHRSGADTAASPRDSQVNRMLGRDCCTELAPPRPSLTASRLDADLLPGAQATLVVSAAMLQIRDRQPAGPTHGPPPGGLLPTRTPLVLRI
jgi:hypothetical protein